jgi:ubiquinone biosynthesis protein
MGRLRREGRSGLVRVFGRAQVALCERLGATFIKVGQIASTRGDLHPPELADELATLRDQVPPFPFADVQRVVETSLGRPLDAVYANFERELAAHRDGRLRRLRARSVASSTSCDAIPSRRARTRRW